MKKVSRSRMAKAFVTLVDKTNYKQLLSELARELVISRRTAQIDLMVRDINRELLRQKRHLEAEVFSAHKLEPAVLREIEQYLKAQTGAQSINAKTHEDPDLVGGIVAETPDGLIDLSLKFKLEQLEV